MEKFIDVSYHKGYMDFQKVKEAGIKGVIMKCTDGFFMPSDMSSSPTWKGHVDPTFKLYWKSLKTLFDWRGAYHFLRVDDEIAIQKGRPTSEQQIYMFYNVVNAEGFDWKDYIILDIEQHPSQLDYLDKRVVMARVKKAITLTEELFGRKPIIYTGAWWWEVYDNLEDNAFIYQYPFWLSHYWNIQNNDIVYNGYYYNLQYNRVFPNEWEDSLNDRIAYCRLPAISYTPTINPDKVYAWQYSESGRIPGVTTNVDLNYYLIDEENWNEARGKPENEEPEEPEPPMEPPEEPEDPPQETKDIVKYIIKVLETLVAFLKKFLGES